MDPNQPDSRFAGIPDRLEMARRRANLRQAQLSLDAGLDRKTCFNIEARRVKPNVLVGTVERLAQALGVSAAWLAFGEGTPEGRVAGTAAGELGAVAPVHPHQADPEEEAGPRRPGSHRQPQVDDHELPPLGRTYDPVLLALGDRLPLEWRQATARLLRDVLADLVPESMWQNLRMFKELLMSIVAGPDRSVVDLVLQALMSDDPVRRGRMALKLIIDGGLPLSAKDLQWALHGDQHKMLLAPIETALALLEMKADQEDEASWAATAQGGAPQEASP